MRKGFPGLGLKQGIVGEVILKFTTPIKNSLDSVCMNDEGKVKKIRGTLTAIKVSPDILNRMISAARGVFNKLLPDVWIASDLVKLVGKEERKTHTVSPYYNLSLAAESTTGAVIAVD